MLEGAIPCPVWARPRHLLRCVMGPQDRFFGAEALADFTSARFAVTDAVDRMGMRLRGPALPPVAALSIPSEPVVRGSVQVSGDGAMHGAAVRSSDHRRLSQDCHGDCGSIWTVSCNAAPAMPWCFKRFHPPKPLRSHGKTPSALPRLKIGCARVRCRGRTTVRACPRCRQRARTRARQRNRAALGSCSRSSVPCASCQTTQAPRPAQAPADR